MGFENVQMYDFKLALRDPESLWLDAKSHRYSAEGKKGHTNRAAVKSQRWNGKSEFLYKGSANWKRQNRTLYLASVAVDIAF